MGDRSGLTRLDRTNGYDDGHDYMRVKKSKLAQQNDQIRDALRNRNNSSKTDIFKGISINVNGRTQPTADELKRLILLNGGDYHPYYRYQTTKFMIATNLSMARMKQLRPDDRVVRPEWITESIEAKCLLPYEDYQLFVEEPRGKTGSVLGVGQDMLTAGSSSDLIPVAESYSRSYRNKKQKQNHPITQSRDIREMFKKAVRSIDNGNTASKKKEAPAASQNSSNPSDNDCSRDGSSQARNQIEYFNRSSCANLQRNQQQKNMNNKKSMLSDYIIKSKNSNRFQTPRTSEENYTASICGLTTLDEVIKLLNDWVGCPEGITDEETACITKYFYDLMSERNYHNKFYEILYAFRQRILEHDDSMWTCLYNNLINTLRDELNRQSEASQNLYQLITLIDEPEEEDGPSKSGSQERDVISLCPIVEVDVD